MSFNRRALIAACHSHGVVARVVVAAVSGSAPREVGAAMLVWASGQSGTIGGGALEFELANRARADLLPGRYKVTRHALGPDIGQCCGGAVEIVTDVFDLAEAQALPCDMIVRGKGERPLAVRRLLSKARNAGQAVSTQLVSDWMVEPIARPTRPIWIWGAGHVGRALVAVLNPLPDVALTWVDTGAERFPSEIPEEVERVVANAPATLVPHAPREAAHLVLTYSHTLDLELCHALLRHGFKSAGLIGSATKWSRFRKRLSALGHSPDRINHIACPIGDPALGKHPQAIAIGVAANMLNQRAATSDQTEQTA
ncbi:MAG: xanthine dehydrogenase accessory protein XdhC [Pseudomonadota bacterium]